MVFQAGLITIWFRVGRGTGFTRLTQQNELCALRGIQHAVSCSGICGAIYTDAASMGLPDSQTLAAVSTLLWVPFVSVLSCSPFFPPHTLHNEGISTNEGPWRRVAAVWPTLMLRHLMITSLLHCLRKQCLLISHFRSHLCELPIRLYDMVIL